MSNIFSYKTKVNPILNLIYKCCNNYCFLKFCFWVCKNVLKNIINLVKKYVILIQLFKNRQ